MQRTMFCASLISSAFLSQALYARSLAEIQQTKELRVCYSDTPGVIEALPKGCSDQCTSFSGPAADVVNLYAASIGAKVKGLNYSWDQQFWNKDGKTARGETYTPQLIAANTCDLFPSHLTKVEWRTKLLEFAILYPSRMMVVTHKDKKNQIKAMKDLAGKKMSVLQGAAFQTWMENENKTTLAANPVKFHVTPVERVYTDIDQQLADFGIGDMDSVLGVIRLEFKNLVAAFPVGPMDEIGWAMGKDHKDLVASVSTFFESMRKDEKSKLNEIWTKYYGMSLSKFSQIVTSVK